MAPEHASRDELAAFLDGRADPAHAQELSAHLAGCPACAALASELGGAASTLLSPTLPSPKSRPASTSIPPARGGAIGRYLVLERAGEGGMGTVLKAYDPELDRRVAIKLIRVDLVETELAEKLRERLRSEAVALARLSHPNVVAVFDAGAFGQQFFVAMEWVDGETLQSWQRAAPRTPEEILARYLEAGRGLAAAHAQGLVHRDFKPENVLLGTDGRVRVSDFGLAVALNRARTEAGLSEPGQFVGTPDYASPEQLRGEAVDARSDLFSFCVALYEALHGQLPFAGATWTDREAACLTGRLEAPPTGRAPAHLWPILQRGLANDPAGRFADMDALLRALQSDPRRRRRRIAATAVASVLLVAGAGATYRSVERERTRCAREAAAQVQQIWSPAIREEVHRALRSNGAAGSSQTWDRFVRELDDYADSLRDAEAATCEARRHAGDVAALQARQFCLGRRSRELSTVVQDLRQSDATLVHAGPGLASQLEPMETCDVVAPMAGPRGASPELEAALARMRVDFAEARFDACGRRARELAERARASDDLQAEAEALYYEAKVAENQGVAPAELVALLKHADRAAVAARDAARVANARIDLLDAVVTREHRFDQLEALRDDARAAVTAAGGTPLFQARLEVTLGNALTASGNFAEARDALEQAVALESQRGNPRDPNLGYYENDLARVYQLLGDDARAAELFGKALEVQRSVFGDDGYDTALARLNLADAQNRLGDARAALAAGQPALQAVRKAGDSGDLTVPWAELIVADALEGLGRDAEAATLYENAERAYGAAPNVDPGELAMLAASLGRRAHRSGHRDEAIAQLERAVKLFGDSPADRHDLAMARLELAKVVGETGRSGEERARALAAQARAVFQQERGGSERVRALDAWLATLGGAR